MSLEVDGLPLLASLDGITMDGTTIWENKLLNANLIDMMASEKLAPEYAYQVEQQLLVSGASECYFTASDGTEVGTNGMLYESDPELRAKLIYGWKQFAEDLAAYQHTEAKTATVAEVIEDLPALSVQLVGQVTASNLDSFKTAVTARIQAINTVLVTDADFATADKMVKFLDDGEKRLDLVKAQALSQTESIDQLFRTIDALKAEMRSKRLTLDKLVKAEKENRKTEITSTAATEYAAHCRSLNARISPYNMPGPIVSHGSMFAEAIKGLKSLDSMRDKVSVALANAKIEANAVADCIEFNQKQMQAQSAAVLFPDFAQVCTKAADDFAALVSMRVAQQKEADEKRLEAERERIRAEEVAKAHAAFNKQQGEAEAAAVREMLEKAPSTAASETQPGATLKLGEINAMLAPVSVNADGLASLGIHPVAHEKNAKLYDANKLPTICRLISEHVMAQAFKKAA